MTETTAVPLNLTTNASDDVSVEGVEEVSNTEMIAWAAACAAITVFGLFLATVSYIRKVLNSPKAKKKNKQQKAKKQTEKEEKSIALASEQGPTALEEFLKQLKKKKKKNWLEIEFKTVCKLSPELPCDIAKKPENKQRNTYPTTLPFDNSRVLLTGLPESSPPQSDYINASYIDGHLKPKAYIIAQGPNRHTIGDFWRMVWFEQVQCIVMATNLFEHARQQCEKYWHNQHGRYGGVDVWLEETDILADFVVRSFRISRQGEEGERVVKQYQYNGWSDHDCPSSTAVLEYRRRIRAFIKHKPGPLLVHCSKGSGRSGAFVAIDMALDILETERSIDVLKLLLYLRGFRPSLVKTVQQYEFVYDTIAMYLHCGETVISIRDLPLSVQKLSLKDPNTKLSGFEQQFKTLQVIVPKLSVGECAGGHRAENRRKSRDIMLQPPERSRPYLITHDSNESTDYINAVYIDGYRHPNAYIVTQWPLKSTINDVWRLLYDYNVPTLVILNDMPFTRSYPKFWPSEAKKQVPYGPLTVEFVDEELYEHVAVRQFKIRKTLVSLQTLSTESQESAKTVRVFQLRTWPNNHKSPANPASLIDLLTRVEDWQLTSCHARTPTCVLSKNGVSRVGMYCSLSHCWDKLKAEGEIDIFTAVKTVKINRPQLIDNLMDYVYCYRFMVMLTNMLNQPLHQLPSVELANPGATPLHEKTIIEEDEDQTTDTAEMSHLANKVLSPPTSVEFVEESPPNSIKLHPVAESSSLIPRPWQKRTMVHSLSADARPLCVHTVSDGGRSQSVVDGTFPNYGKVRTKALSAPQLDDDIVNSIAVKESNSEQTVPPKGVDYAQELCSSSGREYPQQRKDPRLQVLSNSRTASGMSRFSDSRKLLSDSSQHSSDYKEPMDIFLPEVENSFTTCNSVFFTPDKYGQTQEPMASSTDKCSLLHSVPQQSYCTFGSNPHSSYSRAICVPNTHRCSLPIHPRDFIRDEDLYLHNSPVFMQEDEEVVEEVEQKPDKDFEAESLSGEYIESQTDNKVVTIPVVHVQPASDSSSPNRPLLQATSISASNHSLQNYSTPSDSPTHSFHSCFSVNPETLANSTASQTEGVRLSQQDLAINPVFQNDSNPKVSGKSMLNGSVDNHNKKCQQVTSNLSESQIDHMSEEILEAEAKQLTQQILKDAVKMVLKKPSKSRRKKSSAKIERSHSESSLFNGEHKAKQNGQIEVVRKRSVKTRGSISLLSTGMKIVHKVKSDTGLNCYVNLGYSESTYL